MVRHPSDEHDERQDINDESNIIHSVAVLLEKCNLVKYECTLGKFVLTELGRIASHYYLTYSSIAMYNKHLRTNMGTLELFCIFALSNEFKLILVSLPLLLGE
jgi:pre-mRNA-splicing helicase BRR2